jgi:hypothetical protein
VRASSFAVRGGAWARHPAVVFIPRAARPGPDTHYTHTHDPHSRRVGVQTPPAPGAPNNHDHGHLLLLRLARISPCNMRSSAHPDSAPRPPACDCASRARPYGTKHECGACFLPVPSLPPPAPSQALLAPPITPPRMLTSRASSRTQQPRIRPAESPSLPSTPSISSISSQNRSWSTSGHHLSFDSPINAMSSSRIGMS